MPRVMNTPLTSAYNDVQSFCGFGTPFHAIDADMCNAVVGEYSAGYSQLFLDHFAALVASRSNGLLPVLECGLSSGLGFHAAWDLSFAEVRRAALAPSRFSSVSATHAAASVGLRILTQGVVGSFKTTIDPQKRMRVNRWLMPAAENLDACRVGTRINLQFRTGRRELTVTLRQERGNWLADGAEALPEVRIEREHCILLPGHTWSSLYLGEENFTPAEVAITRTEVATRRAIALLRRHSPRYLSWVDRVLRGVMPCKGTENQLRSGTDFNLPGIVQISYPACAAAHSEMLVHECSHLNYQILTRLGDVDDGSDKTLYYSPVKQTGRPIERILLAYHAFANVLLFYRDCLASGIEDGGYCERNEQATIPQLEVLEKSLRTTKALTPLGRALYEPLAELIW